MTRIEFPSDFRTVDYFHPQDCPAEEPCFFGATSEAARQYGKRVMNLFLDEVDRRWPVGTYLVYAWNTRLYPGHWPTPGVQWHADGAEPESFLYDNGRHVTEHMGCSLIYEGPEDVTTEFALGRVSLELPIVRQEPRLYHYGWWHPQIEAQLREGTLEHVKPNNGEVIVHNHRAVHRSPLPQRIGKRLLIGVSRFPNLGVGHVLDGATGPANYNQFFVPNETGSGWVKRDYPC